MIGETLAAQGRLDEAAQWLAIRREIGDVDDDEPAGLALEALILARRGHLEKRRSSCGALLPWTATLPVPLVIDPRFTLAEILLQAGRTAEAETEAEACLPLRGEGNRPPRRGRASATG